MKCLVAGVVLAMALGTPPAAGPRVATAAEDERERAFVEALRREDPGDAERYVALRDARAEAIAQLRRVESQFNAVGAELKPLFLAPLKDARRGYAERSLALLDFFEARDRRALAAYQEETARIGRRLEEHGRTRAELERLLRLE
jgi:hypothetical protein